MTDTWDDEFIGNYQASVLSGNKDYHLTVSHIYSIGDVFVYTGDAFKNSRYLLCQVSRRKVALIHLEYARYWKSAVKVKDVNSITMKEFKEIVGGEAMFNNFYLLLGEQ
jgi:hypothetical protein